MIKLIWNTANITSGFHMNVIVSKLKFIRKLGQVCFDTKKMQRLMNNEKAQLT